MRGTFIIAMLFTMLFFTLILKKKCSSDVAITGSIYFCDKDGRELSSLTSDGLTVKYKCGKRKNIKSMKQP
jgi:hypothetical protein